MTSGIYKITNTINGKFYIGSSVDIRQRWNSHHYFFRQVIAPYRSRLRASVLKYGIENFSFEIIEECGAIKEQLLEREQFYIDTLRPEYNILPKAGSCLGAKHSDESRERRRLNHSGCAGRNKGIPMTDEQKKKLSAILKAGMTQDRRQKISNGRKGIAAWNKGFEMSDEAKMNMSESHKGKPARNKGVPMSDEQKRKISESMKGKNLGLEPWNKGISTGPQSEETCRKKSENRRGKQLGPRGPRSEETKRRMSESQKGKPHDYAVGKVGGNSSHGNYGITWRNDVNKWMVRIAHKKYGNFVNIEDAIVRRDEVVAVLAAQKAA